MLRRINTIVSLLLCITLLIHGMLGSYSMVAGAYVPSVKIFSFILLALLAIHVAIVVILRMRGYAQGERITKYPKESKSVIIRLVSGLLILGFMFTHFWSYGSVVDGQYVLSAFGIGKMVCAWILVIAVCVHIISSVRAQLVGWGIASDRKVAIAISAVVVLVALVWLVAFMLYTMGMM